MNPSVFNEDDVKKLFTNKEPKKESDLVQIEFQPEKPQPSNNALKERDTIFKPSSEPFFVSPEATPPAALVKTKLHLKKASGILKITFKYLGLFFLLFIISFTIINGQALMSKMKYIWDTEYFNQSWADKNPVTEPTINNENHILIPKIGVNAPITWSVDPDNIISALENGVAHYRGTALPGAQGNIFITGHSSYYIWSPGKYKDVFALLNKLAIGDKIYIQYGKANFTYEVTDQKIVEPDNMEVLNQGGGKTLSLMTCVPIGTNLRRLIVVAEQVK